MNQGKNISDRRTGGHLSLTLAFLILALTAKRALLLQPGRVQGDGWWEEHTL